MRIQVLVLDGVFDVGLAAILDTLATANDLAADGSGRVTERFVVERVGVRRSVRTQQGLSVPVSPAGRGPTPDLVIVPALGCKIPDTIDAALARRDVHDAVEWLRRRAADGVPVTAACTATFVLAETGLLDGGSATTTWWLAPLFRQRFPRVELDESRMIVESGRFATAGAALAHLDLVLWLVRRRSPALAALTARYLIVDSRSSQASYAIPDHGHASAARSRA
jgi:transcriptional regulator GlxA family with amidase domain